MPYHLRHVPALLQWLVSQMIRTASIAKSFGAVLSLVKRGVDMVRGNGNGRAPKADKPSFSDFQFVSYTLSKSEKVAFSKWWEEKASDAFVFVSEVVNSGYKVSLSWDAENDCYIATFTCMEKKSPNYCLVMSSRSDDLWEAIGINLYKHYVLFSESGYPVKTSNSWG